jgi:hypothetical protein
VQPSNQAENQATQAHFPTRGKRLVVRVGMVFEKFAEYGAAHGSGLRLTFRKNLPN